MIKKATVESVPVRYIVTTFYKFVSLSDIPELKLQLLKFCNNKKIKGTILLSLEGINATITGTDIAISEFKDFIRKINKFADLEFKDTESTYPPFQKMKVRIKKEIVAFKVENLDVSNRGEYLTSDEWDAKIEKGDAIIIDTRNNYEFEMGTFKKAINPNIHNFSDLPKWISDNLSASDKQKEIMMFCTGGIRCEKSTAYMKQIGFDKVYHLKGGIIQYLIDNKSRKKTNKISNWEGACFVFDDRLALEETLDPISST